MLHLNERQECEERLWARDCLYDDRARYDFFVADYKDYNDLHHTSIIEKNKNEHRK